MVSADTHLERKTMQWTPEQPSILCGNHLHSKHGRVILHWPEGSFGSPKLNGEFRCSQNGKVQIIKHWEHQTAQVSTWIGLAQPPDVFMRRHARVPHIWHLEGQGVCRPSQWWRAAAHYGSSWLATWRSAISWGKTISTTTIIHFFDRQGYVISMFITPITYSCKWHKPQ